MAGKFESDGPAAAIVEAYNKGWLDGHANDYLNM